MILGIDIGTTHIKVGQYAQDGTVLAHHKAVTPKVFSQDYDHYDASALWSSTAKLIEKTVLRSGIIVEALAIASMGETGLLLDKDDSIVYPMIPWNDHRAQAQCDILSTQFNPTDWFNITGLYPNPIHSVFKWHWLQTHAPHAWQHAQTWLSSMGFVRFKLSGKKHMEKSQAARTMAYDIKTQRWSQEVITRTGIPDGLLPELISATTCVGSVTAEAAAITGLKQGTPIYGGGHDHVCAMLACAVLTPEVALDSLGTAEGLTFGLKRVPDPYKARGFGVGPHVVEGHSYLMGGIYSSGGTLQWLKDLFELKDFQDLNTLLASTEPGDAPLFVPHFFGAPPPFTNPKSKGAFLQLEPHHSKAHLVRAVFEGIAFEIRRHIAAFESLSGQPVSLLRVVGSPSHSKRWMALRASILGKPLELPEHADMVSLGAAMCAGIGAGIFEDASDAIRSTTYARRRFETNPDLQTRYEPIYQTYQQLVTALTK